MKRRTYRLVAAEGPILNITLERTTSGWEVETYDDTGRTRTFHIAPTFVQAAITAATLCGDALRTELITEGGEDS